MKTPLLIDVPKTHPSRREKLKAFKELHEIETYRCYDAWLACHMPSARKLGYGVTKTSSITDIMSKVCRLTDEAGISDYGRTEREAVRRVCENLGIPFEM